jgi:PncC family amidohydrolase
MPKFFPNFGELRFEDVLSSSRVEAHKHGYELLKLLNEISDWNTNQVFSVATAESATGGLAFSTLVDIPFGGSYKYGCFGVYDTDAKRVMIGVQVDDVYTLKCAKEMAEGILRNSNAAIAISITGNAMPLQTTKEEIEKVGEVFIGIAFYTGEKKIKSYANVYNFCEKDPVTKSTASICKLWYTNTISEKILSGELTEKQKKAFIKKYKGIGSLIDGNNPFEITSFLASYIRNMIVAQAFQDCLKYVKLNRKVIVVPKFLIENKQALAVSNVRKTFPKDTNNKVLSRHGIKARCVTKNCNDADRKVKKLFNN